MQTSAEDAMKETARVEPVPAVTQRGAEGAPQDRGSGQEEAVEEGGQ